MNNDFRQALIIMCTKYNVYYDENLMQSSKDNNIEDGWNLFQQYIKYISSLPQYNGLKYKDSVWENKNTHTKTEISEDVIKEEKPDIDFINDDIKGVKKHIEYSLKQHNVNEHNKWLNSLRDAFLLRERLESAEKPIYKLYYDIIYGDTDLKCIIFFKEKMHTVVGDLNYIAKYIINLCNKENVDIHGDFNGIGMGLADTLMSMGYIIKPTTLVRFDRVMNGREFKQNYSELRGLTK